jgi:tungstate transport system substrate-binding protein
MRRRTFLQASAAAAAVTACSKRDLEETPAVVPVVPVANPGVVRIASVPTAVEGRVLPELVASAAVRTEITANPDAYDAARAGHADLVISHYGHRDAEKFVLDGLGEWPRTVFSNQMALVGPPSDPAKIRGLLDAAEAFQRIAESKSPFVVNDLDGVRYLVEILWHAIGKPARDGWLIDDKSQRESAMRLASQRNGYTLWGLTPFLRTHKRGDLKLEPLVLADPLLQRLLVSVVVTVPGANVEGARAIQAHLLAPSTQARIRTTRYPTDEPTVCWVPAGRHNRTAVLPKT